MFSSNSRATASSLLLSYLLLPAAARVIWVPEAFNPDASDHDLTRRQDSTCGGDSSLFQCGDGFPSDFCCPSSTECLRIATNSSSIEAAICCPAGQDCATISPVSCDLKAQNPAVVPYSQMHSDPPQKLETCANGCCPMGYDCANNRCVAAKPPTPASSAPTSSTEAPSSSIIAGSGTKTSEPSSTSTDQSAATNTDAAGYALGGPNAQSSDSSDSFNPKSFAAGFIPGIAIGALIAACLLLLIFRKGRRDSVSYLEEKQQSRNTLTDLGPWRASYRPTMHGRSISEPQVDPTRGGHRTDFLRGTPPRAGEGYTVDVRSPATPPTQRTPRIKALFSRSPFMTQTPSTPPPTQPPLPAHLKRGTLSFTISPVRALKKQKSMHSLRRQMTEMSSTSRNNSQSRRKLSRSGSTETIQVLMPSNEPYTPDRRPQQPIPEETLSSARYEAPSSATSWASSPSQDSKPAGAQVVYASSSRYPSTAGVVFDTPTRPPMPRLNRANQTTGGDVTLGSPYTPTNHDAGLGVPKRNAADTRRDTTFSAMMERAGLRRSDLVMGSGGGDGGKK